MRDTIIEILKRINEDVDFENAGDFIEEGLLDSFDVVTLVEELEEEFGIEILGSDIVPVNFVNPEAIEELVQKYREED